MPLSTLLISWLLGGKIPFFVSSNSQLFVYGCGLPSPSPCSSVTVNTSALQLICLAKYGFKDLGVSAVQQGLTVTTSACLKLSVWGGWHTLGCVIQCVHVHAGLSLSVFVCMYPVILGWAELWRSHGVSPVFDDWRVLRLDAILHPELAVTCRRLEGSKAQFRLRLIAATFLALFESWIIRHVFTDLYLGQVPLGLGAVSQIVVRLPSIIHRLDPLWHNKHFSVKDDSKSNNKWKILRKLA